MKRERKEKQMKTQSLKSKTGHILHKGNKWPQDQDAVLSTTGGESLQCIFSLGVCRSSGCPDRVCRYLKFSLPTFQAPELGPVSRTRLPPGCVSQSLTRTKHRCCLYHPADPRMLTAGPFCLCVNHQGIAHSPSLLLRRALSECRISLDWLFVACLGL